MMNDRSPTSRIDIKRIGAALLILASVAGCRNVAQTMAEDGLSSGRYVEAAEAARVAVEAKPDVPEYKNLLQKSERMAAGWFVERADRHMIAGDFLRAEHAADRALAYSPANDAAKKIKSTIYSLRQRSLEQLTTAEQLLADEKFDEAILLLERLQPKAATFPQIKQVYQTALLAGYNFHLGNGIGAFESADYEGAVEQFEVALQQLPTREDGQAWMKEAGAHLKAQGLCDQAQSAFDKGFFRQAHDHFEKALAELPNYAPARKGLKKALYHWTDDVYARARRLEGQAIKPALLDSLDAYAQCERQIAEFKDVRDRVMRLHNRLAEIYLEEARHFARRPNLRTIGLAHYCLTQAQQHDPNLKGLAALLPKVERLFDIYRRVSVQVQINGKGRYPGELARALVERIEKSNFPGVKAALGRTGGLHAQYDGEVAAVAGDVGSNTKDLDVPYSILQIGGEVRRDFAKKTGADKPILITSSYVSHTEKAPNSEYADAAVRAEHWRKALAAATKEAAGLGIDAGRARQRYNERRSEYAVAADRLKVMKVQQEKLFSKAREWAKAAGEAAQDARHLENLASSAIQAANGYLAKAKEYDAKAKNAQTKQEADYYAGEAAKARTNETAKKGEAKGHSAQADGKWGNARAADATSRKFADSGAAMNPGVNQRARDQSEAERRLQAAKRQSDTASSALKDAGTRVKSNRYAEQSWIQRANSLAPQLDVKVATSYSFSKSCMQVFGGVRADLYILAEHGDMVAARPSVNVTERLLDDVNRNVQGTDINGYAADGDDLPSAAELQAQLQAEATKKLAAQVCDFLRGYHHKRFYQAARRLAAEKQAVPAANAYACFLACEKEGLLADNAREYLAELSRKQLK